jgi:hypothetical protein
MVAHDPVVTPDDRQRLAASERNNSINVSQRTATQLLLDAVIDHENDALRRRLARDDGERSDSLRHAPLQSNTYSCP